MGFVRQFESFSDQFVLYAFKQLLAFLDLAFQSLARFLVLLECGLPFFVIVDRDQLLGILCVLVAFEAQLLDFVQCGPVLLVVFQDEVRVCILRLSVEDILPQEWHHVGLQNFGKVKFDVLQFGDRRDNFDVLVLCVLMLLTKTLPSLL